MSLVIVTGLVCRCPMDGCLEAFGKNVTMKNHITRVHQHQEDRYKVQLFTLLIKIKITFSVLHMHVPPAPVVQL